MAVGDHLADHRQRRRARRCDLADHAAEVEAQLGGELAREILLDIEPFEAAEVDGASAWQRFRYLTLPLLRPTILVVLMFRSVDCLKVFSIIFGTTGGGPLTTTESVQVFAYRLAFKQLEMSVSMTTMVVFSVIAVLVLLAYQRLLPVGERAS